MNGGPLPPAKRPTGAGRIGVTGPVLAVLLLALAVVLAREALVASGRVGGGSWAGPVLDGLDGTTRSPAVTAAGAVAVLLGLWLVATGFSRRSRRTVRLQGSASATTTTRDVARLATGAARQQDGVLHASSRAGRRRVDVTVSATTPLVRATVETAVRTALDRLDPAPRVRVRLEAPAAVAAAPGARPTSAVGGTS